MDGYIEFHPTNRKHRAIRIEDLDNFEVVVGGLDIQEVEVMG
jgi:hypothetical protein